MSEVGKGPDYYNDNGEFAINAINDDYYANLPIFQWDDFYLPDNQPEVEATLVDAFNERYEEPHEQWCLQNALLAVRSIVGVNTPQYRFAEEDLEDIKSRGISVDDDGYFMVDHSAMSSIFLLPPSEAKISKNNSDILNSAIKAQYNSYCPGKVPQHIIDTFKAVFAIIGAKKVRDDRNEGVGKNKIVLYEGNYLGTKIYLGFYYQTNSGYGGLPLMRVIGYDEDMGAPIIDELRPSDWEKLQNCGIKWNDIYKGERKGLIKHSTVDAIVSLVSNE